MSDCKIVDIPDYEGLYGVTKEGKVYSYDYGRTGKLRELNQHKNQKGRMQVGLHKTKKGKVYFVHRLVGLTFIPNPENKSEINHKDGNPLNNHISNLEWATKEENTKHARDNGHYPSGEKHPGATLTEEEVIHIKELLQQNTIKGVSEITGVKFSTINHIKSGTTWKALQLKDKGDKS